MEAAAALGIVKRVFIGTRNSRNRDLADAEECILESNFPPMSGDQDEDGGGRLGKLMPVVKEQLPLKMVYSEIYQSIALF